MSLLLCTAVEATYETRAAHFGSRNDHGLMEGHMMASDVLNGSLVDALASTVPLHLHMAMPRDVNGANRRNSSW